MMIDKLIARLEKNGKLKKQAGILLSANEAKKSFADAVCLINEIMKKAKKKNPQLELELK